MRSARFQSVLLYLALAATVLMALAPVVSRWMQAGHMSHAAMVAHDESAMVMSEAHGAHHAMSAEEHARHMAAMTADAASKKAPVDPHAAHGEACEYCTMASRLLPWLALLLIIAPLLYPFIPVTPRAFPLRASLRWPAHPARGPPRFS